MSRIVAQPVIQPDAKQLALFFPGVRVPRRLILRYVPNITIDILLRYERRI